MTQRLPTPGGDDGNWGTILNGFLEVSLNSDGTLNSSVVADAQVATGANINPSKIAGTAEVQSNKGAASGYAPLNSSSLVPTTNLGTGTASSSNYLRGDGTWVAVGGGGSSTLASDSDVSITSPSNNQVLTYNSGTSTWINQTPSSAPVSTVFGRTGAVVATTGDYTAAQVTGALLNTNNLSDVSSTTTARTNLGLGSAATQASSVFAQTANNLSDLASTSTARTNLGLGAAATENIGTTSGTVAAGNDSRITGAIQTGATAGGDLSGTLPSPTVAKVNGIAVSGTPSTGQVIIATSSSAASWQTISGGGAVSTVFGRTGAVVATTGDYTAAQVTGALQSSNNLSDVASASTARTNLGLGSAATISSTAGGDLSGTLPSPTVAKINGITLSGTPSNGQVLTATSGTAADWQTPGGGSSSLASDTDVSITSPANNQVLTYNSTASKWENIAPAFPVFNVMNYGATGNGSTDDTTAVQAAITAAAAANGGTVFFPTGKYLVQPLSIPPGTVLQGVNAQSYYNATTTIPNSNTLSTLVLKTGSSSALISPNDGGSNTATAVHIYDLALNCNGVAQGAINLPDQGSSISRFWIIERVYAYNCTQSSGAMVYIGDLNTAVTLRDCVIFNGTSGSAAGYTGLGWYGSDGRADNCFIGYFANTGLEVYGGTSDITLTWRGGGIFTCGTGVAVGGAGVVFEGTSIDHCQNDGVYVNNGPIFFIGCTFHTNSMSGNGNNSNINVAGNNVTCSVVGCRAAPIDSGSNNPAYMVKVGGTGCTLNLFGNVNEGVSFTSGWTNYSVIGTTTSIGATGGALSASTGSTTTVPGMSLSLGVGTFLVTATIALEFTSGTSAYYDMVLALGTAVGSVAGTPACAVSQPASTTEFLCQTATVSCIVTVTTAGTVVFKYQGPTGASVLQQGVNNNLGQSSGITATSIVVAM